MSLALEMSSKWIVSLFLEGIIHLLFTLVLLVTKIYISALFSLLFKFFWTSENQILTEFIDRANLGLRFIWVLGITSVSVGTVILSDYYVLRSHALTDCLLMVSTYLVHACLRIFSPFVRLFCRKVTVKCLDQIS